MSDYTAIEEKRVFNPKLDCPYYRTLRPILQDFRDRQKKGEDRPDWDSWSEFDVYLEDGSAVRVVYNPFWTTGSSHFQFYGSVTDSGYLSYFHHYGPEGSLVEFAESYARDYVTKHTPRKAKKKNGVAKFNFDNWRPLFDQMI